MKSTDKENPLTVVDKVAASDPSNPSSFAKEKYVYYWNTSCWCKWALFITSIFPTSTHFASGVKASEPSHIAPLLQTFKAVLGKVNLSSIQLCHKSYPLATD